MSNINASASNYWISPEGSIIPVTSGTNHATTAIANALVPGLVSGMAYDEVLMAVMEAGYIRGIHLAMGLGNTTLSCIPGVSDDAYAVMVECMRSDLRDGCDFVCVQVGDNTWVIEDKVRLAELLPEIAQAAGQHVVTSTKVQATVDSTVPTDYVINHVVGLHDPDELYSGDLLERLESYPEYQLMTIPLNHLNLNEYAVNKDKVEKIARQITDNPDYPPIVVSPLYGHGKHSVIDGMHRANALAVLGQQTIKAYVGVSDSTANLTHNQTMGMRCATVDAGEQISDAIQEVLSEFLANPDGKQRWTVVPATAFTGIWQEYMDTGLVTGFKEKQVENIADTIIKNIARLQANTDLAAHGSMKPKDLWEEAGLGEEHTPELEDKFMEYITDPVSGQWRISDYGLDKLVPLAFQLSEAGSAEEQLQLIDRVLNVAHQRSDLAAMFVEGGSATLNELSGVTGSVKRASAVTDTPEFKAWFGDSKVVDGQGKPLVVFHGSQRAGFTEFDPATQKHNELGFFFAPNPEIASRYAGWDELFPSDKIGGVLPVYLSIQNPLVVDFEGSKYGRKEALTEAIEEGYDGAHFINHYDAGGVQEQWVAFYPEQIKSALSNSGAFDKSSPDITAAKNTDDKDDTGIQHEFYDPNSTANEGRKRFRNPKDFDQDSFRRWSSWAGKKAPAGVSFIVGELKDSGKKALQTIRFNKDKLSETEAKKYFESVVGEKGFEKPWAEKDWLKQFPEYKVKSGSVRTAATGSWGWITDTGDFINLATNRNAKSHSQYIRQVFAQQLTDAGFDTGSASAVNVPNDQEFLDFAYSMGWVRCGKSSGHAVQDFTYHSGKITPQAQAKMVEMSQDVVEAGGDVLFVKDDKDQMVTNRLELAAFVRGEPVTAATESYTPSPYYDPQQHRTPDNDDRYFKALAAGDMELAQTMVQAAANAAGYNIGPAYHGTSVPFTEFNPEYFNKNESHGDYVGEGFYFSRLSDTAAKYIKGDNGRLMAVYLSIHNPVTPEEVWPTGWQQQPIEKLLERQELRKNPAATRSYWQDQGKDGLVDEKYGQYAVFSPNQIKSADTVVYDDAGNIVPLSQRFNTGSNDIRASKSAAINLPIEKGDEILTGHWMNHKEKVKSIGEDKHGQPTVNGKPILRVRIPQLMAGKNVLSSYKLQPMPDAKVVLENGVEDFPVATLKDDSGGVAHIIEDDHCYVLLLDRDGVGKPTPYWFPEALNVVKTLPVPKRAARNATAGLQSKTKSVNKDQDVFTYDAMSKDLWYGAFQEAAEHFNTHFDLENNDPVKDGSQKQITIKDGDSTWKFNCQMMKAGGDWEDPSLYFRCQLVTGPFYGSDAIPESDIMFPGKDISQYSDSAYFVLIPPPEAGNTHLVPKDNGEGYVATTDQYDEIELDYKAAWNWVEQYLTDYVQPFAVQSAKMLQDVESDTVDKDDVEIQVVDGDSPLLKDALLPVTAAATGVPSDLVVYHGSPVSFDTFDLSKARDGAPWFTTDKDHAASFGPVKAYTLDIKNPMVISQEDLEAAWDVDHPEGEADPADTEHLLPRDYVQDFVAGAKREGHDGLVITGMADRDITADMYLPFTPEQIRLVTDKTAAGNRNIYDDSIGTFITPDGGSIPVATEDGEELSHDDFARKYFNKTLGQMLADGYIRVMERGDYYAFELLSSAPVAAVRKAIQWMRDVIAGGNIVGIDVDHRYREASDKRGLGELLREFGLSAKTATAAASVTGRFWLTPNGTRIDVPVGKEHLDVALEKGWVPKEARIPDAETGQDYLAMDITNKLYDAALLSVYNQGYARGGEFELDAYVELSTSVSDSVLSKMKSMVWDWLASGRRVITVDVKPSGGTWDIREKRDWGAFIREFRGAETTAAVSDRVNKFWITPDGSVVDVPVYTEHVVEAIDQGWASMPYALQLAVDDDPDFDWRHDIDWYDNYQDFMEDIWADLFGKGYIRGGRTSSEAYFYCAPEVTAAAKNIMIGIIKDYLTQDIPIIVEMGADSWHFTDKRGLGEFIRETSATSTAALLSTNYWITPDGETVPVTVQNRTHEIVARNRGWVKGRFDQDGVWHVSDSEWQALFAAGYIRVGTNSLWMAVTCKSTVSGRSKDEIVDDMKQWLETDRNEVIMEWTDQPRFTEFRTGRDVQRWATTGSVEPLPVTAHVAITMNALHTIAG